MLHTAHACYIQDMQHNQYIQYIQYMKCMQGVSETTATEKNRRAQGWSDQDQVRMPKKENLYRAESHILQNGEAAPAACVVVVVP